MITLSIIILNYNTKDITLECLSRVSRSQLDKYQIEVLIVDNNSTDGSLKELEQFVIQQKTNKQIRFKLIHNDNNVGFGAGNNIAIRKAKGKYILLLNSDVMVTEDTIKKQIEFMNKYKEYSVSTCFLAMPKNYVKKNLSDIQLFLQDKSLVKLDPASHRGFPTLWASITYFLKLEKLFPKSKIFGQYHQGWKDIHKIHKVNAISGGFFMIKKEIFNKIGLFDEAFFMYGEDLDLCMRINQAGCNIGFYPDNWALHLKGMSGRKSKIRTLHQKNKSNYYFWQTMEIFYNKHYTKKYGKFLSWIIIKIIRFKASKNI